MCACALARVPNRALQVCTNSAPPENRKGDIFLSNNWRDPTSDCTVCTCPVCRPAQPGQVVHPSAGVKVCPCAAHTPPDPPLPSCHLQLKPHQVVQSDASSHAYLEHLQSLVFSFTAIHFLLRNSRCLWLVKQHFTLSDKKKVL